MPGTRISKLLATPLLLALTALPVSAQQYGQYDGQYGQRQDRQYSQRDRRDQRNGNYYNNRRVPNNYYGGVRDGARGGNYDRSDREHYRDGYDDRYHHPGGIGPGKGAAIGAAGGAVLGALFGGGLKGVVIGGAAGTDIDAVVGDANQNRRDDGYRR
jgi:hypothetical protein